MALNPDLDLSSLASSLSSLLQDPTFYLSPECRAVRQLVHSLHGLQTGGAFGGRGASGEAADKAARQAHVAALRAQHQKRDNDRRLLAGCALREGRMALLEQLALPAAVPSVLDGAVEGSSSAAAAQPELFHTRACYICHSRFRELHHFYDSLCPECAALNWSKRHAKADLSGRVALVTGARVKIGFHVALKLLRCGARVLATSRFPKDTVARFAAQPDFADFASRLEVFGLDFRDLPALEAFCTALKATLPRLDILINNACQTVRRPAAYYAPLMQVEGTPLHALPAAHTPLLQWHTTLEAARGGAATALALEQQQQQHQQPPLLLEGTTSVLAAAASTAATSAAASSPPALASSAALSQLPLTASEQALGAALALPQGLVDVNAQQVDLRRHNSWTMLAEEVETPELAEVMAINAMAPFILCARLKGLMSAGVGAGAAAGSSASTSSASAGSGVHGSRPAAALPAPQCRFIVNVSSMEGKFYFHKLPTHPHTNAAKAALNMLTRTCAGEYAEGHSVFMSAVDTGWINEELPRDRAADKARRSNFATPLDEVDAAARILDPVLQPLGEAQGEGGGGDCRPWFGAFFKDYKPGEW